MDKNKIQSEIKLTQLRNVSFKQFISFIDSLDEERKTWSLDLQTYDGNIKEFYKNINNCILAVYEGDIVGLTTAYFNNKNKLCEISAVVKKEYQRMGIGNKLLIFWELQLYQENFIGYKLVGRQYVDNIAATKNTDKAGWDRGEIKGNIRYVFKVIKDINE